MTQREFDQLAARAGEWEAQAAASGDGAERSALLRCAEDLRRDLRQADTEPDVGAQRHELPPMRWPSDRPTIDEEA